MSSERIAIALLTCGLFACAGTLEDPDRFRDAGGADLALGEGGTLAACPPVETGILHARCATAGCHAATGAAAGLDLASPDVLSRLARKPASGGAGILVVPGDPAASVLYTKLTSAATFGSRMPLGASLDDASVACVNAWISSAR